MCKILKNYSILLFSALLFVTANPLVVSGKSVSDVGPFEFAVGEDTFEGVKDRLEKYGCAIGISAITSGKAAVCKSKYFDVDWLSTDDVLFVFNAEGVLDAVSMKRNSYSRASSEIAKNLKSKYTLVKEEVYLKKFQAGWNPNIIIDLDYEDLLLSYYTKSFEQKYLHIKNGKMLAKESKQKNQL